MTIANEKDLFKQLRQGDEKAFQTIFKTYYAPLCLYASHVLSNDEKAEEIVQELFVHLWSQRKSLKINSSLKSYLFRSVKNHCLNWIQHLKIREKHAERVKEIAGLELNESDYFLEVGLAEKIEESIASLPEKRRQIFKLSREQGLKYQEIADQLGLSVKTVETHMGLALKQLREKLSDYKDYFIGLTLFNSKK
ncbi:RNA polymerase sigma-70 factor [Sunxiuqinia sp. sy24]|uniref:RNA polymerase sigma-70 factor n=1 Tax=Sunxiuqinia sp. sy24 TaxID=3461495 RepID=UPI0040466C82